MIEDDIAFLIDRLLRAANLGYHQRTRTAADEKIWPADGLFLVAVSDMQPANMTALSKVLARDKSQLTRTASKLEDKGYVVRSSTSEDGRVTLLSLTDKGEDAVRGIRAVTRSALAELLEPLSPQERADLARLLRRLAPASARLPK